MDKQMSYNIISSERKLILFGLYTIIIVFIVAFSFIVATKGLDDLAIGTIVTASSEQATAISEINSFLKHLDRVTQENVAMAEESTVARNALCSEATTLESVVQRFQVHKLSLHYATSDSRTDQ